MNVFVFGMPILRLSMSFKYMYYIYIYICFDQIIKFVTTDKVEFSLVIEKNGYLHE